MVDEVVPFELKHLPDGEAFIFDYEKSICHVLKIFRLVQAAIEHAIAFIASIDGANINASLCHVMPGGTR